MNLHRCLLALPLIALAGCFNDGVRKANIELRKEVDDLKLRVDELSRKSAVDEATIRQLQSTPGTTLPTLPKERLDQLFTVASIEIDILTRGEDFEPDAAGDEGFKVNFVPRDLAGDQIKAAGSVRIELFDLKDPEPRLGEWTLPRTELSKRWIDSIAVDGYLLDFRWKRAPVRSSLLVKVTFTDLLTQRTFEAQKTITVRLPTTAATPKP
jgi:hypothetical protein